MTYSGYQTARRTMSPQEKVLWVVRRQIDKLTRQSLKAYSRGDRDAAQEFSEQARAIADRHFPGDMAKKADAAPRFARALIKRACSEGDRQSIAHLSDAVRSALRTRPE